MLNMLLSFAQFEREVTGERIRDKIAASKRRGMWMGGPLPLGYDVHDRKLVVNEAEAETVRHIFRSYCELGNVRLLGVKGAHSAGPSLPAYYQAAPECEPAPYRWGIHPLEHAMPGHMKPVWPSIWQRPDRSRILRGA